jgi:RHS repeat-associated protein
MSRRAVSVTLLLIRLRSLILKQELKIFRSGFRCLSVVSLLIVGLGEPCLVSQLPDPSTFANVPTPGVGHSYIGMGSETVGPSDGNIVFNLPLNTPKGRQLDFPFSIRYVESAPFLMAGVPQTSPLASGVIYYTTGRTQESDSEPFSLYGWSYTVPFYQANAYVSSAYQVSNNINYCWRAGNYSYQSLDGRIYAAALHNAWPDPSNSDTSQTSRCGQWGQGSYGTADRNGVGSLASLSPADSPTVQPEMTLTERNGITYSFPRTSASFSPQVSGGGNFSTMAQSITDRNGNQIVYSGAGIPGYLGPNTSGSYQDTLGRQVVAWSGLGNTSGDTISVAGLSGITVKWTATTVTFPDSSENFTNLGGSACSVRQGASVQTTVVSEIDLPNGTSYKFSYGGRFGRLTKIIFPNGGYVRYDWGVSTQGIFQVGQWPLGASGGSNFCYLIADAPAIVGRHVSFDGSTESLSETYSYQTTWPSSFSGPGTYFWQSKQTTVTTSDSVSGQTFSRVYTYGSVQAFGSVNGAAAVELSVVTKDPSGNALLQQNEAWTDVYTKVASQEIDDLGNAKTTIMCPDQYARPVNSYEYGFQGSGTASSLPNCPLYPPVTQGTSLPPNGNLAFGLNKSLIGPLLRQTNTAYGTLSSANILDTPISVVTTDPMGTRVAETDYGYDEFSVSASNSSINLISPAAGVRGNLTSISGWLNTSNTFFKKTFTYYDNGNLNTITDECGNTACSAMSGGGHTTTLTYRDTSLGGPAQTDTQAFPTTISEPTTPNGAAHVRKLTWNYGNSLLTSESDENSQSTTYAYQDSLNRLTDIYSPLLAEDGNNKAHTSYSYSDGPNSTVSKTDPVGVNTVSSLDGMGRTVRTQITTDPAGANTIDTVYDAVGTVRSISNPYRSGIENTVGITTFVYDALGRKVLQCDSDNGTSLSCTPKNNYRQWVYRGSTRTFSDEQQHSWQDTFDALGHLTNVVEPNNISTAYSYNLLDKLISVTQSGGLGETARTRNFYYDSLSHLITSNNPETGLTCYGQWSGGSVGSGSCQNGYDANGNLLFKTDATGMTINYTYDVLNRVTERKAPEGLDDTNFVYTYDEGSNGIGRLTTESHLNTAMTGTQFFYDSMGRVTGTNWYNYALQAWTPAMQNVIYDLAGNLTQYTYPDGRTVSQTWDGAGNLSGVFDGPSSQQGAFYVSGMSYWPNGSLYTETYFDGVGSIFTLNPRLQPCYEHVATPILPVNNSGDNLLHREIYYASEQLCSATSGNNGNIQSILEGETGSSESFSYDSLDRLTGASTSNRPTATSYSFLYSYDSFGNMIPNGMNENTPSFAVDAANRLTLGDENTGSLQYYPNGRLKTSPSVFGQLRNFIYTADGDLRFIDSGNVGSYLYNGEGQRTFAAHADGTFDQYVYLNGQVMADNNSDSSWTDYIYANGQRIASVVNKRPLTHVHMTGTGASCALRLAVSPSASGLTVAQGDHIALSVNGVGSVQWGTSFQVMNSSGAVTSTTLADQNGTNMSSVSLQDGFWTHEAGDMSSYAGSQIQGLQFSIGSGNSGSSIDAWVKDVVITHADGTITPIITSGTASLAPVGEGTSLSGTGQSLCAGTGATLDFNQIPISTLEGTSFYLADQVGTTQMELSPGGWPVWEGFFTPFGQELLSGQVQNTIDRVNGDGTNNRYKFTGKERDSESGLDYFGARYYASAMGRWMSPDWSSNPEAVPYSHLDDPQSLNLYGYVRNNPLSKPDLDGHGCPPDCGDGLNDSMAGTPFEGHGKDLIQGSLEIGAAAVAGPEVLEAAGAAKTLMGALGVGVAAMGVTGTAVNGVTHVVGSATGTDVDGATNAVTAVTTPIGAGVAIVTKSTETGSNASDLVTAVKAGVSVAQGKGVANPAEAASSLGGARDSVKQIGAAVRSTVSGALSSTPTPPPPPPAPKPPCNVAGASC